MKSVPSVVILLLILLSGRSEAQTEVVTGTVSDSVRAKASKSPKGAMIRSLVFPGWGQFYNEQYIKSILVFSGMSTLVGVAIHNNNQAKKAVTEAEKAHFINYRNQTFWFMGAVTLLSMLDAYIDAQLYDFDTGPDLELEFGNLHKQTHTSMWGVALKANF